MTLIRLQLLRNTWFGERWQGYFIQWQISVKQWYNLNHLCVVICLNLVNVNRANLKTFSLVIYLHYLMIWFWFPLNSFELIKQNYIKHISKLPYFSESPIKLWCQFLVTGENIEEMTNFLLLGINHASDSNEILYNCVFNLQSWDYL